MRRLRTARGLAGRPVDSTRAITAAWARGQVAVHGHELVAGRIELVPRPGDEPFAAVHSAAGCCAGQRQWKREAYERRSRAGQSVTE